LLISPHTELEQGNPPERLSQLDEVSAVLLWYVEWEGSSLFIKTQYFHQAE
jgi:hypothetical protein